MRIYNLRDQWYEASKIEKISFLKLCLFYNNLYLPQKLKYISFKSFIILVFIFTDKKEQKFTIYK